MYSANDMQAFWSPQEITAVYVVMCNHLLNRLDSDALIQDCESFEKVYANLEQWSLEWVTEKNRTKFNSTVEQTKELSPKHQKVLYTAVHVMISHLDSSKKTAVVTNDDKQLAAIIQRVKKQEGKLGWASLRLELVLKLLQKDKTGETTFESKPQKTIAVEPQVKELLQLEDSENEQTELLSTLIGRTQ
jgi:hypothetical protein